jgi:hypothetical protein
MARGLIKPLVAFYIGGMGVYYHALFCRYGFQDNADLVRELYNNGQRKEASAAVSDELIDAIAICGPATTAARSSSSGARTASTRRC